MKPEEIGLIEHIQTMKRSGDYYKPEHFLYCVNCHTYQQGEIQAYKELLKDIKCDISANFLHLLPEPVIKYITKLEQEKIDLFNMLEILKGEFEKLKKQVNTLKEIKTFKKNMGETYKQWDERLGCTKCVDSWKSEKVLNYLMCGGDNFKIRGWGEVDKDGQCTKLKVK